MPSLGGSDARRWRTVVASGSGPVVGAASGRRGCGTGPAGVGVIGGGVIIGIAVVTTSLSPRRLIRWRPAA